MTIEQKKFEMVEARCTLSGRPLSFYAEADIKDAYADVIVKISAAFKKQATSSSKYPFKEVMDLTDQFMEKGEILTGNEVDVARVVYKQLKKEHKAQLTQDMS